MALCAKGYAQSAPYVNDSLMPVLSKEKNIYKLIIAGQENEIKKYFNHVSLDELIQSDSGAIVKAINKLNTKNRVTHSIWILEAAKSRTPDIRKYIYTHLLLVEYNKPNFMLKTLINNYFTNFHEQEDSLLNQVSSLHRNMIR